MRIDAVIHGLRLLAKRKKAENAILPDGFPVDSQLVFEETLLREAADMLETHPDGWISVQDELPYPCEEVLVYFDSDDYDIDYAYTKNGVFGFEEGTMKKVTHWRPLPEPPKED